VLIDTGGGRAESNTGKLVANLRAGGIDPEQIDTVILTHAHAGHIEHPDWYCVINLANGPAIAAKLRTSRTGGID
jgi:metal-dependent hydrolase (beta-lactamase superfamily II)